MMTKPGMPSLFLVAALAAGPSEAEAQGPQTSYFHHPSSELPWADCVIYHGGGSAQRVPFTALVSTQHVRAPLGTGNLTRDVAVDGPLVFIGNGLIHEEWNSYHGRRHDWSRGEIDVSGKIVLFSYDAPDAVHEEFGTTFPPSRRIREAAERNAAAVVLFPSRQEYPPLGTQYQPESETHDIPVIAVSRRSAVDILAASGGFQESVLQDWAEARTPPESRELITRMRIELAGAFSRVETDNFMFSFPRDAYSDEVLSQIAELNERSLAFLRKTLQGQGTLEWQKLHTVSFPGFDSKLFYTAHWGRGLATQAGVFNVLDGGVPDYGLVVHENMHVLAGLNWSRYTTPFLSEGIAKHVEALATDEGENHRRTMEYLERGQLFPLAAMTTFMIGPGGLKTDVAYPASGSFTGFLMETYGLESFRDAYVLEARRPEEREEDDTWARVYGKGLQDLEVEWLSWLAREHGLGQEPLRRHLERLAGFRPIAVVGPAILDDYAGVYNVRPGFSLTITRDGERLLAEWPAAGRVGLWPASETEFFFNILDGTVSFIRDEEGRVTHLHLDLYGEEMKGLRDSATDQ